MGRLSIRRAGAGFATTTPRGDPAAIAAPGRRAVGDALASRVAPATAFAIAGLVAVGLTQAADALTFSAMTQVGGIGHERNPIVALAAVRLGIPALFVAKAALVILVVAIAVIVARQRSWLGAVILTAGMIAGLVGAFSNFLAIS